jgi:hypothetical protein
VLRAWI